MSSRDEYRAKAAALRALAQAETDKPISQEAGVLAQAYEQLAVLSEKNSHTDVVYEPPLVTRAESDRPKT